MSTEISKQGDVVIAMPCERLDTTTAPATEEDLTGQVDAGETKIVVDFSKTAYISSAGLRVLLLEVLAPLNDPRVVEMAQRGMESRGDGVRLESMRILVDRDPRGLRALCDLFEDDDSVEVRQLLATRLYTIGRRLADPLDLAAREALANLR